MFSLISPLFVYIQLTTCKGTLSSKKIVDLCILHSWQHSQENEEKISFLVCAEDTLHQAYIVIVVFLSEGIRMRSIIHLAIAFSPFCYVKSLAPAPTDISRRDSFVRAASIFGGIPGVITLSPLITNAIATDETPRIINRMGGLLVSFLLTANYHRMKSSLPDLCNKKHLQSLSQPSLFTFFFFCYRNVFKTVEGSHFLCHPDGINLKARLEPTILSGKILSMIKRTSKYPVPRLNLPQQVCE